MRTFVWAHNLRPWESPEHSASDTPRSCWRWFGWSGRIMTRRSASHIARRGVARWFCWIAFPRWARDSHPLPNEPNSCRLLPQTWMRLNQFFALFKSQVQRPKNRPRSNCIWRHFWIADPTHRPSNDCQRARSLVQSDSGKVRRASAWGRARTRWPSRGRWIFCCQIMLAASGPRCERRWSWRLECILRSNTATWRINFSRYSSNDSSKSSTSAWTCSRVLVWTGYWMKVDDSCGCGRTYSSLWRPAFAESQWRNRWSHRRTLSCTTWRNQL